MLPSRRKVLWSLLPLLLAACSRDSGPAKGAGGPQRVQLQLNWSPEPEFGGFYAAQQRGLFAREGLDVSIVTGSPSVPVPQLAASGKVEFAVIAGPQLLELREQGGELLALYAVFQGNPMGVMVHEASPYKTLGELWASESTISFESGLTDFRWLDKTYPGGKHKVVPYSSNLGAFAADPHLASQCFFTSEPVALELQGVRTRVFMIGESGYDPYNVVVVTTPRFYAANRELCQRFVRAVAAGWRSYLDDPKGVNEHMSHLQPSLTVAAMARIAEVQRRLVETAETAQHGLGCMTSARWQTIADQLAGLGRIRSTPDVAALFAWDPAAGTAR